MEFLTILRLSVRTECARVVKDAGADTGCLKKGRKLWRVDNAGTDNVGCTQTQSRQCRSSASLKSRIVDYASARNVPTAEAGTDVLGIDEERRETAAVRSASRAGSKLEMETCLLGQRAQGPRPLSLFEAVGLGVLREQHQNTNDLPRTVAAHL